MRRRAAQRWNETERQRERVRGRIKKQGGGEGEENEDGETDERAGKEWGKEDCEGWEGIGRDEEGEKGKMRKKT